MKKKIFLGLGIFLTVYSLITAATLLPNVAQLSEYGKGALAGKVVFFLAGVIFLILGIRIKTKS